MNCRGPNSSNPELTLGGYTYKCGWKAPLVKGAWHDFVVRVYFHSDASKGNMDLWYRAPGQGSYSKVVDRCMQRTLISSSDTAYWKLGYYTGNTPGSVYFDAARAGNSFASVALQ